MIGRAPSMTRRFGPVGSWRKGGLGQVLGEPVNISNPSVIYTGAGTTADCSRFSQWLLNTGCWKYSPQAWNQMNAATIAVGPVPMPNVVPPPAVAYSTNPPAPSSAADASAQTTDVLAAAQAANAQTFGDYFGQAASSLDTLAAASGSSGINWTMWLLLGAGVVTLILAVRR